MRRYYLSNFTARIIITAPLYGLTDAGRDAVCARGGGPRTGGSECECGEKTSLRLTHFCPSESVFERGAIRIELDSGSEKEGKIELREGRGGDFSSIFVVLFVCFCQK